MNQCHTPSQLEDSDLDHLAMKKRVLGLCDQHEKPAAVDTSVVVVVDTFAVAAGGAGRSVVVEADTFAAVVVGTFAVVVVPDTFVAMVVVVAEPGDIGVGVVVVVVAVVVVAVDGTFHL